MWGNRINVGKTEENAEREKNKNAKLERKKNAE